MDHAPANRCLECRGTNQTRVESIWSPAWRDDTSATPQRMDSYGDRASVRGTLAMLGESVIAPESKESSAHDNAG